MASDSYIGCFMIFLIKSFALGKVSFRLNLGIEKLEISKYSLSHYDHYGKFLSRNSLAVYCFWNLTIFDPNGLGRHLKGQKIEKANKGLQGHLEGQRAQVRKLMVIPYH